MGRITVLRLLRTISDSGALFGEVAVLLGVPHTTTVRALRDSTFHVADDPMGFLHAHPPICLEMAKLLSRRLQLVTDYLADLKEQFSDRDDHLAMVDEVLDTLVNHQDRRPSPARTATPTLRWTEQLERLRLRVVEPDRLLACERGPVAGGSPRSTTTCAGTARSAARR